jgi:hypothetical protein
MASAHFVSLECNPARATDLSFPQTKEQPMTLKNMTAFAADTVAAAATPAARTTENSSIRPFRYEAPQGELD